jgi:hypothetical protein
LRQEGEGLFALLDRDGDGRLGYNDLVATVGLLAHDLSAKELSAAAAAAPSPSPSPAAPLSRDSLRPPARPGSRSLPARLSFPSPSPQPRGGPTRAAAGMAGSPQNAGAAAEGARPKTAQIFLMQPRHL